MKAVRIFYDKALLPDGAVVEMTIWQLPRAALERPHGLKYSLFYGYVGQRVVGYDNALGKGDHKHLGALEFRYKFESVDKLIADFLQDVERMKKGGKSGSDSNCFTVKPTFPRLFRPFRPVKSAQSPINTGANSY